MVLCFYESTECGILWNIYIIYLFITNCNWAYARWQCYVNNEQYISSREYRNINS
jgi:hypothetical protein